MTIPCEQKEAIGKIGETVESIHLMVTEIAIQNQRIGAVELTVVDHETRVRKIEKTPIRIFWSMLGLISTILTAWATHSLWG